MSSQGQNPQSRRSPVGSVIMPLPWLENISLIKSFVTLAAPSHIFSCSLYNLSLRLGTAKAWLIKPITSSLAYVDSFHASQPFIMGKWNLLSSIAMRSLSLWVLHNFKKYLELSNSIASYKPCQRGIVCGNRFMSALSAKVLGSPCEAMNFMICYDRDESCSPFSI